MPRIVKEEEYAARRNEILDAAQQLIYTKGYELMTIQDILDSLGISKGAFYHYYSSKQALLEAVLDRLMDQSEQVLLPVIHDPSLTALEKLQRYFDTAASWKTAQKELMLAILRMWYVDDNALVRQKMYAAVIDRIGPMIAKVIHQGIREGVMTTAYPDHVGQVILAIFQGVGDTFARLILSIHDHPEDARQDEWIQQIQTAYRAYSDALERVIGAPPGSITLVDDGLLRQWFSSTEEPQPVLGEAQARES